MPIPVLIDPIDIIDTTIIVTIDIIYDILPILIKVEASRVAGYRHFMPMLIPMIKTYDIV